MNQNILHVGLDVDDTQYHGSAFNQETTKKGVGSNYYPGFSPSLK
jgi:hypothetical protein